MRCLFINALITLAAVATALPVAADAQNPADGAAPSLAPHVKSSLKLPYNGTTSAQGNAFTITSSGGTGGAFYTSTQSQSGVYGAGLSASDDGVTGEAVGSNGTGVGGTFDGNGVIGNAGAFFLRPTNVPGQANFSSFAAVNAVNSAGNGSSSGRYGQAGRFTITNPDNQDPAVYAASGSNGAAIYALTTNSAGGSGIYAQAAGGQAAFFQGGASGSGVCSFAGGPGFSCSSDRNLKQDFSVVDATTVLAEVAALPEWRYRMKHATSHAWYLGPTAQDFRAAFGLGDSETMINTANAQGVALVAIKALDQKVDAKGREIAVLKDQLAKQSAQIAQLQAVTERLAAVLARSQTASIHTPVRHVSVTLP